MKTLAKKNAILFLVLLCGLLPATYGQNMFAPLGSVWNYSYGTDEYTGYTLQKVTGDTTIAGTDCRRVLRKTYKTQLANPSAPVDSSEVRYSYIASYNDTVFYYNEQFSRFLPLYIFNVAAGDTMVYHVPFLVTPSDTLFRVVVDSIGIVNVDGILLKRIYNTPLDGWGFYVSTSKSYTQLLGADQGLVVHGNGSHTANIATPFIRCYKDSIINYTREPGTICEGMDGINSINFTQHRQQSVDIYPVPSKGMLYVKLKNGNGAIRSIFITDLSGRRILSRQLLKMSQEVELKLENIASGVYLIHVEMPDQSLVRKISVY